MENYKTPKYSSEKLKVSQQTLKRWNYRNNKNAWWKTNV